ncbi:ATP-binding protein [Kitasatospora sp. NPDC049258]|uniref:ATP-binding protein n=1 Tax=Kitasatospora sp. NPDC049258 TaxID=3155394 RepID=UPI003433254F
MDGQARFPRQRSASGSGPASQHSSQHSRLPRSSGPAPHGAPPRAGAPAPRPGPSGEALDQPADHLADRPAEESARPATQHPAQHPSQPSIQHPIDHAGDHAGDQRDHPDHPSGPAHEPDCVLHHRLHAAFAPADLVAVGAIRHRLRAALSRWGVPELADTAELLTSELVTNALLHTGKGAVLDAVLTAEQRLRIEVLDGTTRLPGRRPPTEWATSGRGLLLVEALADDWGVQLRGDGKVTWFELGPA